MQKLSSNFKERFNRSLSQMLKVTIFPNATSLEWGICVCVCPCVRVCVCVLVCVCVRAFVRVYSNFTVQAHHHNFESKKKKITNFFLIKIEQMKEEGKKIFEGANLENDYLLI
jgi:hypothetical protein